MKDKDKDKDKDKVGGLGKMPSGDKGPSGRKVAKAPDAGRRTSPQKINRARAGPPARPPGGRFRRSLRAAAARDDGSVDPNGHAACNTTGGYAVGLSREPLAI